MLPNRVTIKRMIWFEDIKTACMGAIIFHESLWYHEALIKYAESKNNKIYNNKYQYLHI